MSEWQIASGAHRDTLGEGPTWSPRRGALLWVDIFEQVVQQMSLATGEITRWLIPERVGFVVEQGGKDELLAGLKSGVFALALNPLRLERISSPETDRPQSRINDAKVDPNGRLWFGTKDDNDTESSGALYRLDPDMHCSRQDDGYRVTNGPAFSADGHTMWHTDSLERIVYIFDIDERGNACNRRPFLRFPEEWGLPDGMTVDAEGGLWIAHWGGSRISRFTPAGKLDRVIWLPTAHITSVAFAGDALDRMFVTSSRLGCESDPLAGALFELRPGVRGIAPIPFAGSAQP